MRSALPPPASTAVTSAPRFPAALAAAGCPVLSLQSEQMSLEDVFLQLTETEAPAEETPPAEAAETAEDAMPEQEAAQVQAAPDSETEPSEAPRRRRACRTRKGGLTMLAIFKRETKSYFTGMIGYVVIGVMLAFIGLYYSANCIVYGTSDFSIVLYSTTIAMLFVLPALSMRSFADERRNKTDSCC